jgi:hypothetical protein
VRAIVSSYLITRRRRRHVRSSSFAS